MAKPIIKQPKTQTQQADEFVTGAPSRAILKRLTIDIEPEMHQRFKVAVTMANRDMREVMTQLIQDYIDTRKV